MLLWEEGWQCLFDALDNLSPEDLNKEITIRNQAQCVMDAIQRQIAHYAYHVGQIVYISKINKGDDWQSLSIPKNNSETYNAVKFSKDKEKGHFTDEFLKQEMLFLRCEDISNDWNSLLRILLKMGIYRKLHFLKKTFVVFQNVYIVL